MIYPITKSGTIGIITSQVSSSINTQAHGREAPKLTSGSGGNALLHYSNYILEFEPRWWGDNILEDENAKFDPEKNKIIGHWTSITIKKSDRENENFKVKYPIKHGRVDGKSIWVEQEIIR